MTITSGGTRSERTRAARIAGVALLATTTLALAGCGRLEIAPETSPVPAPGPDPSASVPAASSGPEQQSALAADSCAALAARLDPAEQVGQLFMLGVSTEAGVTDPVAQVLADTGTGQVLLLGDTEVGVAGVRGLTDAARAAAAQPDGVALLLAVDQEGGQVQRLRGPGFDRIPAAIDQARLPQEELRASAQRWGEQLREAGIDLDLAPVAGVVPPQFTGRNEPLGVLQRHYGPDAATVGPKAVAFVEGMQQAGVGTSVKHFPGLGRVEGNTDHAADVVDADTTRDDPGLAAFAEVIDAGVSSVMVGTAVYHQIDPGVPAAFSPVIVQEMLRGDLGYDGAVISDDLGAAVQVQQVLPGQRATRFLRAGGDVVINGDPAIHTEMVDAVRTLVDADAEFAAEVETKTVRALELKADLGLADCAPS